MIEANDPILPELSKATNIHLNKLEETLLQNVHSDYPQISIEKEFAGGYSGTRVFLVLPINARGAGDARIVTKIGSAIDLRQEKENFDQHIERSLPFIATRVKQYYRQGDYAALNYVFAGDASLGKTISLEEYYRAHSAEEIEKTLEMLLDKALGRKWYTQSTPLNVFFRAEYARHLPAHQQLLETVRAIFPSLWVLPGDQIKIPDVAESYLDPLKIYPTVLDKTLEGRRSLVHGDLHLRNVLVDETGKGWLIDFAKVTERHNLFDFIKLETYVRLMGLAQAYGSFSLNEYAQLEQALNTTLVLDSAPLANPMLEKARQVIGNIRKIARKYMGPEPDFKNEYFPALLVYSLAMLKYYASNGPTPTQLIFITACSLSSVIFGVEKGPQTEGRPYFENETKAQGTVPSPTNQSTTPTLIPSKETLMGSQPPLPGFVVGRDDMLHDIKTRIDMGVDEKNASLTVLRGLPGVGKTTLIAALAHDAAVKAAFPDGVLYTSLGPNPNLVAKITGWARSMGMTANIKANDLEDASAQLTAIISEKQMLLIVDDVWDAEDFQLFRVGGHTCHTLVTTRSKTVAQELAADDAIYLLRVLDEAADDKEQSLAILKKFAPVVVAKYPEQSLELARELQGLPLALRVAGRLLNKEHGYGFGVRELLSELRRGGKLLDAEAPSERTEEGATPTVKAIFQQSLERLPIKPRNCFTQLGVFARNPAVFRLAAMQAVWQVDDPQTVIRELVDRGLLEWLDEQAGYQMHALFYDYVQPSLIGEIAEKARKNHFVFFTTISRRYEQVNPDKWSKVMAEFEAHYPELKQALANFKQEQTKPDAERLLQSIQMIDTLHTYWKLWKQVDQEQVELLDQAFSYATLLRDPIKQADFAERLGRAKAQQGQWDDGLHAMKQCEIALGDDESESARAIRALMNIHRASIYYAIGDLKTAEKECKRGLKAVAKKKPLKVYAEGQNMLGAILLAKGQLSAASDAFEKGLAAWGQVGDEFEIYRVGDNLRSTRYYLGHIADVRREDESALEFWKKYPHSIGYASALTNLGLVYYIDRRYEDSARLHLEAIEKSQSIPDPRLKAETRANLAWPYMALGRYDEAEVLLKESLEIQKESGNDEYSLDAQRCLAEIEIRRGYHAKAIQLAQTAAHSAHEEQDALEEGAALRVLGQTLFLNGEIQQAKTHLESSFALLSANEYQYESFLTLQALIEVHTALGNVETARVMGENVRVMAGRMGLK